MSRATDQASPGVTAFEVSTDGVRASERPEFWTEITGRRMESTADADAASSVDGGDISRLGGRQPVSSGIGAVLAAYMRAVAAESARLSSSELALAMRTAGDLALATIQHAASREADVDSVADSLYLAACTTIDEHCIDPSFSPAKLVALVGCSRARLYRLFAAQGTSVANAIWQARLKRAHHMLSLPAHRNLALAELAFRCGFIDQSTFSRMFKHRYGMTPSDLREASLAGPLGSPQSPPTSLAPPLLRLGQSPSDIR